MKGDETYQHFISLKNNKESKCQVMRDINSFFNPDDDVSVNRVTSLSGAGVGQLSGTNQIRSGELLDVTGTDLLTESVTYVLGLFFDESRSWFALERTDFPSDHPVNKVMQMRGSHLWSLIGNTNYYQEMALLDWDVYVHGHGLILIKSVPDSFAVCRTKNPINVYFNDNEDGEILEVFWEENYSAFELAVKFSDEWEGIKKRYGGVSKGSGGSDLNLVTAIFPVRKPYFSDNELEALKGYKYARRYFLSTYFFDGKKKGDDLPDVVGFRQFEGFRGKVAFPLRDVPTRQHPYGKGEGKRALPKARILNSLVRVILKVSKMFANPPKAVVPELAREMGLLLKNSQKAGYDVSELVDGATFIYDPQMYAGQEPVKLLQLVGDVGPVYEVYKSQREQFSEMFPIAGSIYKTARQSIDEIRSRSEQQQKRLGPLRANYMQEGLSQHLRRFYEIAKAQGHFKDFPLPEGVKDDIDKVKYIFNSFLVQTGRLNESFRLNQSLAAVSNYLSIKPTMVDYLDSNKIMKESFKAHGVFEYLLDDDAVSLQRRETAQRMNDQLAQQNAAIDAQALSAGAGVTEALIKFGQQEE